MIKLMIQYFFRNRVYTLIREKKNKILNKLILIINFPSVLENKWITNKTIQLFYDSITAELLFYKHVLFMTHAWIKLTIKCTTLLGLYILIANPCILPCNAHSYNLCSPWKWRWRLIQFVQDWRVPLEFIVIFWKIRKHFLFWFKWLFNLSHT